MIDKRGRGLLPGGRIGRRGGQCWRGRRGCDLARWGQIAEYTADLGGQLSTKRRGETRLTVVNYTYPARHFAAWFGDRGGAWRVRSVTSVASNGPLRGKRMFPVLRPNRRCEGRLARR